jgi:hypothetical protein
MRAYVRPDILREIKANKLQLEALWRDQSSSKYFRYSPKLEINFDRSPTQHQSAQCFFGDGEMGSEGPLASSRCSPPESGRSGSRLTPGSSRTDKAGPPFCSSMKGRKGFPRRIAGNFSSNSFVQFHCMITGCCSSSSAGLILGCTYGAASRAAFPPAIHAWSITFRHAFPGSNQTCSKKNVDGSSRPRCVLSFSQQAVLDAKGDVRLRAFSELAVGSSTLRETLDSGHSPSWASGTG